MAKEMIKESNPLEGYPISAVFPIFKPCTGCCEKKVDNEKQEPLLEETVGKKPIATKKKQKCEGVDE